MAMPGTTQAPAELEAYCVKCKTTRKMTEIQLVTTKNGKPAAKGKCPVCGTTMMKFLPSKK
jgi:ssDNA-binding Zn-finger/Zn-ribbon topoisomerase 1